MGGDKNYNSNQQQQQQQQQQYRQQIVYSNLQLLKFNDKFFICKKQKIQISDSFQEINNTTTTDVAVVAATFINNNNNDDNFCVNEIDEKRKKKIIINNNNNIQKQTCKKKKKKIPNAATKILNSQFSIFKSLSKSKRKYLSSNKFVI